MDIINKINNNFYKSDKYALNTQNQIKNENQILKEETQCQNSNSSNNINLNSLKEEFINSDQK